MFQDTDPPRPGQHPARPEGRPHTVTAFDDDLLQVAAATARAGGLAEELLSHALSLISRGGAAEALAARRLNERLRAMERATTERAASVVALRQPMATDLRRLLGAMRVAAALGRCGDLSANFADAAAALRAEHPGPRDDLDQALRRFGLRALAQLGEAISAHQTRDPAAANAVWRRDGELDAHHEALSAALLARMEEAPDQVAPGARRLFMAKNLERIGDQARRIAAATWWVANGAEIDAAR